MYEDLSPQELLKYYRRRLEEHEAEQKIRLANLEEMSANATRRQKKRFGTRMILLKTKVDFEVAHLKQLIAGLERQIAELDEAGLGQPTVKQAAQRLPKSLGEQPGLKQKDSAAEQPERFGKRKRWGNRKPPQDPR